MNHPPFRTFFSETIAKIIPQVILAGNLTDPVRNAKKAARFSGRDKKEVDKIIQNLKVSDYPYSPQRRYCQLKSGNRIIFFSCVELA
jgi:hypothetical protein